MACPDDQTLLAMLEHSVDPKYFNELERHIDGCENCRKAVAALAVGSRSPSSPHQPFAGVEEAAGSQLAIGTTIHGRYTVTAEIGRGGMGTVYLAHDKSLGRDVALKLHRAGSGNDRLQREATAMAKLSHPNVVNVFEVTTFEDRMFVAMEYVRGGTLRTWLAAAPRTWREIVAMLVAAGRGLAAAHAAGLVHRDFKPENVLVGSASPSGTDVEVRPRVGDFGLARIDELPSAGLPELEIAGTAATMTHGLAGTPAYMSPEQLAGDPADMRSDQYAFCVVAWECLTGRRPFAGATLAALQVSIELHELPKTPEIPDRVRRVLVRGLENEPALRFRDVRGLLAALERAAKPRTVRNIITTIVAAGAITAGAFVTYNAVTAHQRAAACVAAHDKITALFSPSRATELRATFVATGSPLAISAYDHASPVLDKYTTTLADQALATCRDREQPERTAAARRACLASRSAELSGLVDQLARADAALVQRAADAAWAVYDPVPCNDASPTTGPVSAEDAARLGALRAMMRTGKFREGIGAAAPILTDARARKDKSLELDVLMTLGELQYEIDPVAALVSFHDAETLAEAQGRDIDAARALDQIANADGTSKHDYAGAHREVDLARAKLARIGGNAAIEGKLAMTEAQILVDENRFGEASVAMKSSIATLEKIYGRDHPAVGSAYGVLSEIERGQSHHDEALAAAKRTLEILTPALGEDHPTVAGSKMNLAAVLLDSGDYAQARKLLLEADTVFHTVYGDDHPLRAAIFGNLGTLELAQQHYDAALEAFHTARGIIERTEGPMSAPIAGVERDIANTLGAANRLDEALIESRRAVAVLEKLGPDGEPRLSGALVDLCEVQLARGQPQAALVDALRALHLAQKRPADANPGELADARFVVARAEWDANHSHSEARALAKQALAGQSDPERKKRIADWLQTHAK